VKARTFFRWLFAVYLVAALVALRCVVCVGGRAVDEIKSPVVEVKARDLGRMRGVSTRRPRKKPEVEYVDRLVLNYAHDLTYHVTGYTRFSDAGDPWRKTYASVNFLPGGKLFNPRKPYLKKWTKLHDAHYTVAVPVKWRHLFEDRVELPDGTWFHRYRIWCDGYTPPGKYAVPRDRITAHDRFDFLFTSRKGGKGPTARAYAFTSKAKTFEVWRYDWVKVPKGNADK